VKQTPEEKAAAAAAKLRALVREAHEATQALAAAMKAARTQVDGYLRNEVQKALDHYTTTMQSEIDGWSSDARADCNRVLDRLNEAMSSVCTIVVRGLQDGRGGDTNRADIVIDLRGEHPVSVPGDSAQASAILAEAQFTVVLGPNARPLLPGWQVGGSPS